MDAAWIGNQVGTENTKLNDRIEQFKSITDDTVKTSRRLYNYLYPQMLDDIGLVGTINWHANSYIRPNNIAFNFITELTEEILPQYHRIWLGLYRIYQECTTNILRYADAKTINISLDINGQSIEMSIQDDGIGFEISKVDTKVHHGLLGMRERVYSLGGNININSVVNKGTTITVNIPLVESMEIPNKAEYIGYFH